MDVGCWGLGFWSVGVSGLGSRRLSALRAGLGMESRGGVVLTASLATLSGGSCLPPGSANRTRCLTGVQYMRGADLSRVCSLSLCVYKYKCICIPLCTHQRTVSEPSWRAMCKAGIKARQWSLTLGQHTAPQLTSIHEALLIKTSLQRPHSDGTPESWLEPAYS